MTIVESTMMSDTAMLMATRPHQRGPEPVARWAMMHPPVCDVLRVWDGGAGGSPPPATS